MECTKNGWIARSQWRRNPERVARRKIHAEVEVAVGANDKVPEELCDETRGEAGDR